MGRSKKGAGGGAVKLFCYWCDKDFTQEEHLINHQVAKHFRCPECKSSTGNAGKCITLECLIQHCRKVHLTELNAVPNAKQGRDVPKNSMYIYGMDNVPDEILAEWGLNSVSHMFARTGSGATTAPMAAATSTPAAAQQMQQQVLATAISIPQGGAPEDELGPPSNHHLAASAGDASSYGDWSQQVQEWMAKNRPPPEEPPPLPPEADGPLPPGLVVSESVPHWDGPRPPLDFDPPIGASNVVAANAIAQANAMAQAAKTAKLAADMVVHQGGPIILSAPSGAAELPKLGFSPQMPMSGVSRAVMEHQPPSTAVASRFSRSRSRRSRSRSRKRRWESPGRERSSSKRRHGVRALDAKNDRTVQERRRSRSHNANPPPSRPNLARDDRTLNPVESRTIQIIGGAVRSRLTLKAEMEKFGRVEVAYMGNRHDPSSDAPMVRFATASAAQTALEAINAGQVFFDGGTAKAEFKRGGPRQTERRYNDGGQGSLDITSRDIARDLARDKRREERQREDQKREERQRDEHYDRHDRNGRYDRYARNDRWEGYDRNGGYERNDR